MDLKELYHLRQDYTILGLTGRIASGCSQVAQRLTSGTYDLEFPPNIDVKDLKDPEAIKITICNNFLKENWKPFKIINYEHVLLFHLILESINTQNFHSTFFDIFFQNGETTDIGKKTPFKNRFDATIDSGLQEKLYKFLDSQKELLNQFKRGCDAHSFLENAEESDCKLLFEDFDKFSDDFYSILHEHNITKKTRLIHDLANNLREYNTVKNLDKLDEEKNLDNIYTIAITINKLIKIWRKNNPTNCKIVIDSLKNSLELSFFKEKFSAFYMVAVKKNLSERNKELKEMIKQLGYNENDVSLHLKNILALDDSEYKGDDVNKGLFAYPDIENCIQKSEYHLYFSNLRKGKYEECKGCDPTIHDTRYKFLGLDVQLMKFISLIHQPGIVTPTAIERTMQIAFNAKYNSGCISRQVGAVITDENYSVKSIGWNDVAQGQVPCSLRSITDLINNDNPQHFSDFELGEKKDKVEDGLEGDDDFLYKDGKNFKEKVQELVASKDLSNLNGRNCPYCFKTFHNSFENEKNQVHTRSLHAEENAMMQISKYGGHKLKDGYLFTTASPCELCSKKAFQLGIKYIYFIDPYPGIASKHTLKNGSEPGKNPQLVMFQGALGRTFHKLYEPFMSYKDELSILTKIKPKPDVLESIKKLDIDDEKLEKIKQILEAK